MHVLVICHWGGLPAALADAVSAVHASWASGAARPLITRLDPVESFRHAWGLDQKETLFAAVRRRGYRTVLLGATTAMPRAASSAGLADPRRAMEAQGIDEVSMHDGSVFEGNALAHDEEVLAHAERVLARRDTPVFLVVNLLSGRDVQRMRFRSSKGTDVFPAKPHVGADGRSMPKRLETTIPHVTDHLALLDRTRHGEHAQAIKTSRLKDAHGEYAAQLEYAREVIDKLERRVSELVVTALGENYHVAHMASSMMGMGEHGVRGVQAPTSTCCDAIWSSTVPLTRTRRHVTIDDVVAEYVHETCGVPMPPPPARLPPTVLDVEGLHIERVVCNVNEHNYACLYKDDETPFVVYDLDVDPDEAVNILDDVAHLHVEFREAAPPGKTSYTAPPGKTSYTAPQAVLPQPEIEPSPEKPKYKTARPAPLQIEKRNTTPPRPSPKRSSPTLSVASSRRSSVRAREHVLHTKHR